MAKAYKLPTIGALLSNGTLLPQVSLETIARKFYRFYHDHPLHQKDLTDQSNRDWRSWDLARFGKLAKANLIPPFDKREIRLVRRSQSKIWA